jgi:hypothetical protein
MACQGVLVLGFISTSGSEFYWAVAEKISGISTNSPTMFWSKLEFFPTPIMVAL